MGYLITAAIIVVILFVAAKIVRPTVVFEHEQALEYRSGRFVGVLPAGLYWRLPLLTRITKLDTRQRYVTLLGQEVLTSDGATVRVTLAASWRIKDVEAAVHETDNYEANLYTELQLSLREVLTSVTAEQFLTSRNELGQKVLELSVGKAARFGLELKEVRIKDVGFPGAMKNAFADVLKARQEGLAALERARGETAALRNLANAAKMLESSPALLQLRLLQLVGQSGGNTIMLGVPPGVIPTGFPAKGPAQTASDAGPSETPSA